MRLVSLQLAPYGALTDLTLQLAPGVTVIHGPNEAGKSTVLSAYSDLLCGIHPRTPMAFQTLRKNLRIHADLTLDDGTAVSVTRTPSTSPRDLLDSATSEPVDDALRTALTSALDDQVLRARFGLDHDHLKAGGKALVDGGGDLAPVVFEARTGADVRTIADALQKRVDGLFKSRKGASSRVADAAARLADLDAELTETMATAEAVETAKQLSHQAHTRLDEAREEAASARAEHGRLGLLAESWPFWELYQTLTAALDELDAEGPRLTAAQLIATTTMRDRLAEIEKATTRARGTANKAESDRRALLVDEALLSQQPAIDTLVHTNPAADDARSRITALHADLDKQRGLLTRTLTALDVPTGDDPVAALTKVAVPLDRVADLDNLADDGARLAGEVETARAAVKRAAQELEKAKGDIKREPPAEHATSVDVSSLADARQARERLWQHVRRSWLRKEAPPAEIAPDPGALADRYQDAVAVADQQADDVAAEAGRMSDEQRATIAANAAAAATVAERQAAHARAADDLADAERLVAEWQQLWESTAQAAGLPQGLLATGWRERAKFLADARDVARTLVDLEAELKRHETTVTTWDAGAAALASALDAAVTTETLVAWFIETAARYDQSKSNEKAAEVHRGNQAAAEETLNQLATERKELETKLREVAAEHDIDSDGLAELESRAQRHADLTGEREKPASALQARHPGHELDRLAADLADWDKARLETAVEAAAEAVKLADEGSETAQELAFKCRGTYENLAGRTGADDLRQGIAQATAEVQALIEEWAVTRIQVHLLTEELQSYLEGYENPVLERAGDYLSRLTGGRYCRLQVMTDGTGRSLSVVAADGEESRVGALSEGTATQLYLALRLAGAVEVQRERRTHGLETLPLMLDDVLVTSDDDRSAEALELLGEIGSEQQVVVFTHHAAVAEAARHVEPPIAVVTLAAPEALMSADWAGRAAPAHQYPERRTRNASAIPS